MTADHPLEERVNAYTDDGKLVGAMTKKEARAQGLVMWTSMVITNTERGGHTYFLLTLRSKDAHKSLADYWQIGYTETIDLHESPLEAAARGGEEELDVDKKVLLPSLKETSVKVYYRNPNDPSDKMNVAVLELSYNGQLKPNHSEIARIKQVSYAELEQMVAAGKVGDKPLTGLSIEVWKIYKAEVLEGNGKNHRA